MKVVPLTFQPHFKNVIWGGRRLKKVYGSSCPEGPVGEAWVVSTRSGEESRIQGGAHDGQQFSELIRQDPVGWLGTDVVAETGRAFPLLVKIIDSATDLSMQVHPDEKLARSLGGDSQSKTECWWVLDADPGARLYLGLEEGTTEEDLRAGIETGEIKNLVKAHAVHPGDFFFVPAGAVHAIGGGMLILEIQETSDSTYRLYDWGRVDADGNPRTLHVEEGLRAARVQPDRADRCDVWSYPEVPYSRDILVSCPEFIVERLGFDAPVWGRTSGRRFHLAMVVEGTVKLEWQGKTYGPFKPWAPIFLPGKGGEYRFLPAGGRVTMVLTAPGGAPLYESNVDRIRLQKVLAMAGIGSRRECEKMIAEGRITVDGTTVEQMGTRVNYNVQDIRVDGERIRKPESNVYYLLNKPRGVVCTSRDEKQDRPRAIDFIVDEHRRIYTIGRLDMDSEGIILITNDGEFAYQVSHPGFNIPKVYLVQVSGKVMPEDVSRIEKGVWLREGKVGGFTVQVRRFQKSSTWIRITLREGKNREIRRVLARVGFPVKSLKRVRIGTLGLKGLGPGQFRHLTPEEVDSLRSGKGGGIKELPADIDDFYLPQLSKHDKRRNRRGPRSRNKISPRDRTGRAHLRGKRPARSRVTKGRPARSGTTSRSRPHSSRPKNQGARTKHPRDRNS